MGAAKNTLKNHKLSIHEGVQYPCDRCDFVCNDKGNLKRHLRTMHSGTEGPRFQCDLCEFVFNDSSNLQRHKRTIHDVNYPCDHCGITCSTQFSLKKHMKDDHGLEPERKEETDTGKDYKKFII